MIRLSKRVRVAILAAAGLVSIGAGGTAAAAVAAASSPAGTGTVSQATMTAELHVVQPAQTAQHAATAQAAHAATNGKSSRAKKAKKAEKAETMAAPASPQQIATSMLGGYGWSTSQFSFLDKLWGQESQWNPSASNPSSGAYGIAQALPASQMSSAGPDWQTNPATQIKWGLNYIKDRYGSPAAAWAHESAQGWY